MIRKSPAFIRKQENDSKKKLLAQKHLEKKIEEKKEAKENAGKQNSRWKVYTPGKRKTRNQELKRILKIKDSADKKLKGPENKRYKKQKKNE